MIVYDAQISINATKLDPETEKEYDITKSCRGFSIRELIQEIKKTIPSGDFLLPNDKHSMTRVYQFDNEWDRKRIKKEAIDVTWKFTDLLRILKSEMQNA